MSFLWKLVTDLPGLLRDLLGYLGKREDTKVNASDNSKDVSVAIVNSETKRFEGVVNVTMAMMNHPIFWCAWGLGVFPVFAYHAAVFWVSTFPFWGWTVLKVPSDQIEFSKMVVGSVFTLTGASTVVAGIAGAWMKRA
jgi:hypothetical protein